VLDCFTDFSISQYLCCNVRYGPEGMLSCWDDQFTFQRCCAGPPPVCTPKLCEEVWGFLSPSSQSSYREFWRSDTFYEIDQVWNGSPNCTMAFVGSRVLALTKLPWEEQWETIHTPARATRSSNFQLISIVEALRLMVNTIPLWTLLTSSPWSVFIFERLYGHCKKLSYFFLSDGLPLLLGKLPLSDAGESSRDEVFRQLLKYHLNRGLAVPVVDSESYLGATATAPSIARNTSTFGGIAANLAIAHTSLLRGSLGKLEKARPAVDAAELALRLWAGPHEYSDLFLTQWPLFRLLLLLARLLAQYPKETLVSRSVAVPSPEPVETVLVLVCAHIAIQIPQGYGWTVRKMPAGADNCVAGYRSAVMSDSGQHTWTLLVSPFTWEWAALHAVGLHDAIHVASEAGAVVVGLPTVNSHGSWCWPVRSIVERGRRIHYSAHPTGYANATTICAIADATSGTRAYRSQLLRGLLEDAIIESASTFFVELDLLMRRRSNPGSAAHTCMFPPLHEDDYLDHAELPAALATHHHIEEAFFTAHRHRLNCDGYPARNVLESPLESEFDFAPCVEADVSSTLATVATVWSRRNMGLIRLDCKGTAGPIWGRTPCPSYREAHARLRLSCVEPCLGDSISLCDELRRVDPGLSIRAVSEHQVLMCGSYGAGCLELALDGGSATLVPDDGHSWRRGDGAERRGTLAQLRLWGATVWAPLPSGSDSAPPTSLAGLQEEVWLLHCGSADLRLPSSLPWVTRRFSRPMEECATLYRRVVREVPAHAWTVLVSSFTWGWGDEQVEAVKGAIEHARQSGSAVTGFPMLGRTRTWHWPCRSLRYRYWKLRYGEDPPRLPGAVPHGACEAGGTTSGTRVYRPGALRALLAAAIAAGDPATLLVELDLLALGRADLGPALTCALPAMLEDDFLERAVLSQAFAERYQVEAARYAPGSSHEFCLGTNGSKPWKVAHELSDRRIATRLCYRRTIEAQFCDIVSWWTQLAPVRNFASVKQGTLLTAMIRGGDVSMMPWDSDLELSLYSTGPNPVLSWCSTDLRWVDRAQCIVERLGAELELSVDIGSDFLSKWLFENHHIFPKFRVEVANVFDITFEGWVPSMPIAVTLFGRAKVRVSWPIWEQLFFEVFSGTMAKKIGTSGNNVHSADNCTTGHNACIPACADGDRGMTSCIIEFDDYFAHTRDPYGEAFP